MSFAKLRPMTLSNPTATPDWTCPFCSLLCENFHPAPGGAAPIDGSDCPRALAALAAHTRPGPGPGALIDGQPASIDAALDEAARRLAGWRQPLFGGLGTDITGARALYRLAARTQAICDHADGATLMQGVRAVQDRGQYIATIAEVRVRAELIVCVGTPAVARYPEFFRRIGLGEAGSPCRELVFVGVAPPEGLPAGVAVRTLAGSGDLAEDVRQLAARVDRQRLPAPDGGLAALAQRLLDSPYAVLVWEAAPLGPEAALVIEALNRIVGTLNRKTRAATFGLGGSDGAFSVNQTFTWLSGLPLRTRVSAAGLQHEPRCFDTARLLADGSVDGLLWISSFSVDRLPPPAAVPRIVLGPPGMRAALQGAGEGVFLPVATPGLNAGGHLFRTDGPVVLQVVPLRDDGLPGVADVLARLGERLGATP
mgnify:CR=1 FL=1